MMQLRTSMGLSGQAESLWGGWEFLFGWELNQYGSQVGFDMDWAGYCMVCLEKFKLVLSGMVEILL